jgi:hypothetical protein
MEANLNILTKIKEEHVYQNIVFDADMDKDMVLSALEIVKLYIIRNKRILVGGMSIDLALRKKGKQLYPDNTLPDYDFFSPQFHHDAYDIANELAGAGLTNISVINGLHASTMRVRVKFHVVADCTYIPQNIYDGLPTVAYEAFKLVHPHYQMLNQHLSLSSPYSGAPRETISRWGKDLTRYDILDREYPVDSKYEPDQTVCGDLHELAFSIQEVSDLCFNGVGAALYWHELAKLDGFAADARCAVASEFAKLGHIIISDEIKLSIPKNMRLSWYCEQREILNHPYVAAIGAKNDMARINAFLDIIPRRYNLGSSYEIVDNRGARLGAHKDKIWLANPQALLKYFLMNYIVSFNLEKKRDGYGHYLAYKLIYEIVKWACEKYKKADANDRETFMKYLPTHIVYGSYNWSEAYIMHRKAFQSFVGKIPRENARAGMPKAAFIDSKADCPVDPEKYSFDPKTSPIYQFDGLEAKDPFPEHILYDPKIDQGV